MYLIFSVVLLVVVRTGLIELVCTRWIELQIWKRNAYAHRTVLRLGRWIPVLSRSIQYITFAYFAELPFVSELVRKKQGRKKAWKLLKATETTYGSRLSNWRQLFARCTHALPQIVNGSNPFLYALKPLWYHNKFVIFTNRTNGPDILIRCWRMVTQQRQYLPV